MKENKEDILGQRGVGENDGRAVEDVETPRSLFRPNTSEKLHLSTPYPIRR